MRKHHLLSASALSLVLTGISLSGQAYAATTISTATTAPVVTSTAGDTTVDTAGSITLTSGTAITVDSDNTVTLNGKIDMSKSADNSTGILVSGGRTSGLTVAANIIVTDDYTPTDTLPTGALDGVADYPFAQGTGRYGIHSMGSTPFNGNVSVTSASTIDVEGNNSYGIRFENKINGAFTMDGAMVVLGDNSKGVALDNGATGNVYLSGKVQIQGANSSAITLAGDYDGNIILDGTYTGLGYATVAPLTAAQLAALPANDLLQSGPLVTIGGNVAKGVLLGRSWTPVSTNTSTDQDGDGLTDSIQTTATLTQYGRAPALLVGSTATDITLGGLQYASTAISPPAVNYGLLVRGDVLSYGVYKNVDATAIQLGGVGHAVTIANGVGIYGNVTANGFEANGTGLLFAAGVTTPRLDVNGAITGNTGADATVPNTTAYAIDIASGANLPAINVAVGGTVTAKGVGSTSNATAIRDQSNTLTALTNNGSISANVTASDDNADGVIDKIQHTPIAIDARNNTVGLTLTQTDTAPTDDAIAAPVIIGNILLGSGNDVVTQNGGGISGNIDFGGGANSFAMTGNALFIGKMTGAGTVALDIGGNGVASISAGSALNLTSLHVGSTGSLGLTLDTAHPTTPIFVNSGNAVFDNGAKFIVGLDNVILTPQTFTIMTAANISLGNLKTSLDGSVPYVYHADLATNSANTILSANFRLKSQAEGAFSANEYAALLPVLTAVSQDPAAAGTLMSETTKTGFDAIFNQYLPDYSGENLLSLSRGNESINHTLGSLTLIPDNDGGQYWLQEFGYKTTRERGETAGFDSTGFSFAGGREIAVGTHNMAGVYLSYTSATPTDSFAIAKEDLTNTDLTIGGYWRVRNGGFKGWIHAGAGFTQFESTRELLTANVTHISNGKWNGYSYNAGGGASVDYKAGFLNLTPQVFVNYYGLNEAKHSETGGGDYFDLNVAQRTSNLLSSQALVNVAYNKWFVKPELWLGWKQNVSGSIADTVVNFKNGTPFTLTGGDINGGGPVAGFRISADNEYSYFSLEGDYEKLDAYTNYSVSLRTRFQF